MAATNAGFVNINSDLGESFGPWVMGNDVEVLKIVKSAKGSVSLAFRLVLRLKLEASAKTTSSVRVSTIIRVAPSRESVIWAGP